MRATVLLVIALAVPATAQRSLEDLTGAWQLFIDDYVVESRTGVTRIYHPFQKYAGNPVVTPTEAWEDSINYIYGTVLPNEAGNGYRMWYHTMRPEDTNNDGSNILYATSTNGIDWVKPILNIRSWHGSTANNMIYVRPGQSGITSVMHTPWETPDKQYQFMNFDLGGYWGAYSPDGLHTNDLPTNPMITDGGDVGQFMYDPHTNLFRAYVKVNSYVNGLKRRSVGHCTTTDIRSWPPLQLILEPDAYDDRWVPAGTVQRTHFYGLSAFAYESMYIGFLWIFRATDADGYYIGPVYTEIVSSRDGVHWTREEAPRPAMLPVGPAGAWDDGQLYTARAPIRVGNELWVYYGACDNVHGYATKQLNCSIGLATARKDGFASLGAGPSVGTIETKPLVGVSGPLRVNYRLSGGWLKAEVLDAEGVVIPGYSVAECDALTGDSIDQAVTWGGQAALPARDRLRFRFLLTNGWLYSFHAGDSVAIVAPPTIHEQPSAQTVPFGSTASFTVQATGAGPLAYRWQKNGVSLDDGGRISGAATPTLTLTGVTAADVSNYRCVVTNPHGRVESEYAALSMPSASLVGVGFAPGGTSSAVSGMSADGVVVCGTSGARAYIWTAAEGLQSLGVPADATTSSAAGVGVHNGTVVVAVNTNRSSSRAQQWQGNTSGLGSFSALPLVGGTREWTVAALGTNGTSDLWIAGSSLNGGDGNGREAVRYQQSVNSTAVLPLPASPPGAHDHSDLYGVSDTGTVVGKVQYPGTAPSGGARQAWYRSGTSIMLNTLLGSPVSTVEAVAKCVSRNGLVFGGWSYRAGFGANNTPVIWTSVTPTAVPFIAGGDNDNWGEVLALNGDGTLAGGYSMNNGGGPEEAFLWDSANGTRSLQAWLVSQYGVDLGGWSLQRVTAMSANGSVLAGNGLHNGAAEGWVVTLGRLEPAPPPAGTPGDLDGDGDVDGGDFGLFAACFNGTGTPAAAGCEAADLNGDAYVDGADYGLFAACFNGSGNPPACG